MKRYEEARALLRVYLDGFASEGIFDYGALHIHSEKTFEGQFLPKKTWIRVDLCSPNSDGLVRLRAFVEIVSQLSRSIDFRWRDYYHSFWKDALMDPLSCSIRSKTVDSNANPTEYDNVDQLIESDGPRFMLDVMRGQGTRVDLLRDFLFADPQQALGEEYGRILARLTARDHGETQGPLASQKISSAESSLADDAPSFPRVELGLTCSILHQSAAQFREQFQLLDDIAEHEQQKSRDDAVFRFEVTTLWFRFSRFLEPPEFAVMADALASKISTIKHLSFEDSLYLLTTSDRVNAFGQLLRTNVCCSGDDEPTLQVLQLYDIPAVFPPVALICSTLRYANSLKELDIKCGMLAATHKPHPEYAKLMWAWIAYGIFHPDSEAKLDQLSFTGPPLKPDDMAVLANVISSPHPARYLWVLEHGDLPRGKGLEEIVLPEKKRLFLQLKPKTKFRTLPKLRSQALESVALDSEELEVALQLESWVCVVVPGCGFGWVPSASIMSKREVPSKCPVSRASDGGLASSTHALTGANVKTFSRHMPGAGFNQMINHRENQDQVETLIHLLRLIGHGLEELNHTSHWLHLTEVDLADILDACPNLRRLNLKGNAVENLQALSDRYEAKTCQITSLNVVACAGLDRTFTQLAELLDRPCFGPLQYVAVNGSVESPEALEKLERALKNTDTLRLLYVSPVRNEILPDLTKMRTGFQGVSGSKMACGSKVAFLSVIKEHSKRSATGHRSSSLSKLDSNLAATILAFAGIPIMRAIFL